jgi:hypothetical protein
MGVFYFTLQLLYVQIKSSQYPLDRRWVSPRAGLDVVAKRTIPVFTGNRRSVIQPVASHVTDKVFVVM